MRFRGAEVREAKMWFDVKSAPAGNLRVSCLGIATAFDKRLADMDVSSEEPNPFLERTANQAYFTISALEAGKITMPESLCVSDADPDIARLCPSLSFLLTHSSTGKRIVFDLGIPKETSHLSEETRTFIDRFFALTVEQDVADSLRIGGVDPADVDFVVFSHVHFDHIGDASPFARATFLLGAGGRAHIEVQLPAERTRWLDPALEGWRPLGPFERALDLLGDGSVFVVEALGHMPGHLNALVRTQRGWVYLAGDTAHDTRLMTGERHICVYADGSSAHEDLDAAKRHIDAVRKLEEVYGIPHIIAHAYEWDVKHADAYLPGTLDL